LPGVSCSSNSLSSSSDHLYRPSVSVEESKERSKRISEHSNTTTSNDNGNGLKSAVTLHRFNTGHNRMKISGQLLHYCNKSSTMNILEEAKTISAHQSAAPFLLNNLASTFTNPFSRYFSNFSPQINVHDSFRFSSSFIFCLVPAEDVQVVLYSEAFKLISI